MARFIFIQITDFRFVIDFDIFATGVQKRESCILQRNFFGTKKNNDVKLCNVMLICDLFFMQLSKNISTMN